MAPRDTAALAEVRPVGAVVAGHMLDALENLTDDHVKSHAFDPWFDELASSTPEDLRFRIDAALKSLAVASIELRDAVEVEL